VRDDRVPRGVDKKSGISERTRQAAVKPLNESKINLKETIPIHSTT
jgi:hypothetical protein